MSYCILNKFHNIVLYKSMCVPYYILISKNTIFLIYIYIHTHGDDGDDFLPFFPTCRKSLPPVVVGIWQFGNSRWELRKKPTGNRKGWKKSSHLWKPGPSISKKKKANDFFVEGGNFGKKYHQKSASNRVFLNSPMLGDGHSSHLY